MCVRLCVCACSLFCSRVPFNTDQIWLQPNFFAWRWATLVIVIWNKHCKDVNVNANKYEKRVHSTIKWCGQNRGIHSHWITVFRPFHHMFLNKQSPAHRWANLCCSQNGSKKIWINFDTVETWTALISAHFIQMVIQKKLCQPIFCATLYMAVNKLPWISYCGVIHML